MNQKTLGKQWHYRFLWVVILVEMALFAIIGYGAIYALSNIAPGLSPLTTFTDAPVSGLNSALANAINEIENPKEFTLLVPVQNTLNLSSLNDVLVLDTIPVSVREIVPFQALIPVDQVVAVPVNTSIAVNDVISIPIGNRTIELAINEVFAINTVLTAPVRTEVPVDLEILASFDVDVPLELTIPLRGPGGTDLTTELDLLTAAPVPTVDILNDTEFPDTLYALKNLTDSLLFLTGANER